MAAGIDCQSLDEIGTSATETTGPYKTGEVIYRTGSPCTSLYVVQSGSVKMEMNTASGGVHVNGFCLTGEMFGTDGISNKIFPADAIALERTTICALKLSRWERLCESHPALQTYLVIELAANILHKNNEMMLLHHFNVEARVLIFLHNLLKRVRARCGQSINKVPLSMSKMDIARYLCTTPETFSRRLKHLEDTGVIYNHGRTIEILNEGLLHMESGG